MSKHTRGLSMIESMMGAIILWGTIVLLIGVGWVMNIIDVVGMSFDPLTGLAVLRVVGIFIPPLGAVLGFFT